MTPEEQRIAIAESVGWSNVIPNTAGLMLPYQWYNTITQEKALELPNYLKDLNAMHEVEKQNLNKHTCCSFFDNLGIIAIKDWQDCDNNLTYQSDGSYFEMWILECATASQRAEAYLKAIGKWQAS